MVSAGGRKKRPQKGKRPQPKRGPQKRRRQKTASRRPPAKRVKFNGKTKPKPKRQQKKRSSSPFFDPSKMLRQDGRLLSREAKGLMMAFLRDVCRRVEREAERLRKESQRPMVGPAHVRAALHHIMPKDWKRADGGR
uniref:Histone H2A/H2B/H3 domain-containing protein n=1 Tax=Meleagris gallopavo TaxID=9103 RepID=B1N1B3_MELGA|nr:unknown [Meleagris gallopavo]